jgi:hypothetical protein
MIGEDPKWIPTESVNSSGSRSDPEKELPLMKRPSHTPSASYSPMPNSAFNSGKIAASLDV